MQSNWGNNYEIEHKIYEVLYKKQVFKLKNPINYTEKQEDGYWLYNCDEYKASSIDKNRKIACEMFLEDLAYLFGLLDREDEHLAKDSLEMKLKIKDNIEEIMWCCGIEENRRKQC